MKKKHLVVYDYGQGGVWAFVVAESARDIERLYPELRVVDEIPRWMTAERLAELEATETYDVQEQPSKLLADVIRARSEA